MFHSRKHPVFSPRAFKLTDLQNDALRETVNIGSGQAATSVFELTGQTVLIGIPLVGVSTAQRLRRSLIRNDRPIVCFVNPFRGDIRGTAVWLMPRDTADELARLSWDRLRTHRPGAFFSLGLVHKEIALALTSGYLNAINGLLGMTAVPSSPVAMAGSPHEVMNQVVWKYIKDPNRMIYIAINFEFVSADAKRWGMFMILPEAASVKAMFKRMILQRGA